MKIAMVGWEYPPFKAGGLATHCYGLTRSLADKNVKVDFYMPKTKHSAASDKPNLVIKEVGEAEIFPYDRPDSKEIAKYFLMTGRIVRKLLVCFMMRFTGIMILLLQE